jgi:threonylcarbamoyladenosine tRNA methylthiotransferase MtaB
MANLEAAGFYLSARNAGLAVVNTCAVTRTAIAKGQWMINKARRENPRAKIIVTGCWPKINKLEAENCGVDLVWRGKNSVLVKNLKKLQIPQPKADPPRAENNKYQVNLKYQNPNIQTLNGVQADTITAEARGRSRYFLKIQDGCDQFCSYCVIPYARGRSRSRPATGILQEAKEAIAAGYREIVLCGIHLGLYGRDCRTDLNELLKKMLNLTDIFRIRLSSIEVTEVSRGLIALMKNNKIICPHWHIPLQSGSDKILKLMKRPYNSRYYKRKIGEIRQAIPDAAITTDVIAGFPGETDQDFKSTIDLVKKLKFSRLHVFPFSAQDITTAAKLPGRVGVEEITHRAQELRKLGEKLKTAYENKFCGRMLEVLVEKEAGDRCEGKTEYYFDKKFVKSQIITVNGEFKWRETDLKGQLVKILKPA